MKIFKTLVMAFIFVGACATQSFAGVTFLPGSTYGSAGSAKNASSPTDSATRCKQAGYRYSSCSAGMILADKCPYNSSYYKNCCSAEYRYTKDECTKAGLNYSRNSCGGLYKCL